MIDNGTTINQYTIMRLLGKGGMSEVYLVEDKLGRQYALKILSASLTGDVSFRQRFKREAEILDSLRHSNIVSLHQYFEKDDQYCLVMEYVEGGSLRDLICRTGPLPETRSAGIISQIAAALAYAHGKSIIHRDIKPSNILLGDGDTVKVTDFGIARITESVGLTKTGSRMGTLVYMSPEQIKDSKHVDAKTDVYSLGVTLYEMLSGKQPYDESADSEFDIQQKIVFQDLPDPRAIYPHISQSSVDLVKGMSVKEPEQRLPVEAVIAAVTSGNIDFQLPAQLLKTKIQNNTIIQDSPISDGEEIVYEGTNWILSSRDLLRKGYNEEIAERLPLYSVTSTKMEKYLSDPSETRRLIRIALIILGLVVSGYCISMIRYDAMYLWSSVILGFSCYLIGWAIYRTGQTRMKRLIVTCKGKDIVLMDFQKGHQNEENEAKRLHKEISARIR